MEEYPGKTNSTNKGEIREERNSLQEKNKLMKYLLSIAGIVLLGVILYFSLSRESNYEKGQKYLSQKQYTEALVEFRKIEPDDKDFVMGQSKINYINGLISYNEAQYPKAQGYLSKVNPADEYYRESQLMMEKISLVSRKNDLESLSEQIKTVKDTVIIREKVVDTSSQKAGQTDSYKSGTSKINEKYLYSVEILIKKFDNLYRTAIQSDIEAKKIYLKNMDSLYTVLTLIDVPGDQNGINSNLNSLAISWMQKSNTYINKMIEERAVNETNNLRPLREAGEKEYALLVSLIKLNSN